MDSAFKDHLSEVIGNKLVSITSVKGGDINQAYCIKTEEESFFIKCNQKANSSDMFISEANALDIIARSGVIKTPAFVNLGSYRETAYLILEYITSTPSPSNESMHRFGEQLASLHSIKQDSFGWDTDNYVGTLIQRNPATSSWGEFYINQRLDVQIRLAKDNNHLDSISNSKLIYSFYQNVEHLLQGIEPSLLHGDLWSGNFIINAEGTTFIIDPASYYGHNEVDLAMTELFGGFNDSFYEGYKAIKTIDAEYRERKDLYQLYYLLVHLNLFGKSYEPNCIRIIKKFS